MTVPATREILAIVSRLAHALDADDFTAARACLAEECVYVAPDGTKRGPDAIVASYAAASAWAQRTFDEVRYASEVGEPMGPTVPVVFTDYVLRAGGRWHRHRCRQEFTVGANGAVVRITHHDLPGERERLDAYLRECGIAR